MGRTLTALLLALFCCATQAKPTEPVAERPRVLVHVMPWFEANPAKGSWGFHWTMGKADPAKGELAAHDRPLIGPYDSSDPEVVAYQVELMKAAGIDGAIIDWYGSDDFLDYAMIHRNTELLMAALRKAGLKFALCVEDQIGKQYMRRQGLSHPQAAAKVASAFRYADEHWLADPAYLRLSGRPVVLVFGPQHLTTEDWSGIRPTLRNNPLVFGLPHLSKRPGIDGSFAWVPVSPGAVVDPSVWQARLSARYAASTREHPVLALAFPGFHDYYEQAGVGRSYGRIERQDGRTLADSLDQALRSGAPFVQIATWNDYGEGTAIEPSVGRNHRDLELVMSRLRPGADPRVLGAITDSFLRRRAK